MIYLFPLLLFLVALIGLVIHRNHMLYILLYIEILILSVTYCFCLEGSIWENEMGFIFALYIITLAAVESALGLAIIVSFYKLKGNITLKAFHLLKG